MGLNDIVSKIFAPIVNNFSARNSVIIIAVLLSLLTTLAYKFLTDQKRLKTVKEEMKQLQQEVKKHNDNPDKKMQLTQELTKKNLELMKSSFQPKLMLVTIAPVLIIFSWLGKTFGDKGTLLNLFGWELGWFGTYVLTSIITSMILRKVLKVY